VSKQQGSVSPVHAFDHPGTHTTLQALLDQAGTQVPREGSPSEAAIMQAFIIQPVMTQQGIIIHASPSEA
jgi:hypothetical protein